MSVVINDPGFAVPDCSVLDGFGVYEPSESPWGWGGLTGVSGVLGHGNGYLSSDPPYPFTQACFVVYDPSNPSAGAGVAEQTLDFGSGGVFSLSGYFARIVVFDLSPIFNVLLDGSLVGSKNCSNDDLWAGYTTDSFDVGSGSHTVAVQVGTSGHFGVLFTGLSVNIISLDPVVSPTPTIARPARWVPRPRMR